MVCSLCDARLIYGRGGFHGYYMVCNFNIHVRYGPYSKVHAEIEINCRLCMLNFDVDVTGMEVPTYLQTCEAKS